MSADENGSRVDLEVGLSARASLEAKVSTEIPAQSTGRLVDAITDWFRPFTESRGLKAGVRKNRGFVCHGNAAWVGVPQEV
jgi:hypothetical protein